MPPQLVIRLKKSLLFVLFVFLFCSPAKAATDIWEKINPPALSGTITAVATAGQYVYLGTSQGIYKNSNYGATSSWALINTGLTDLNISSIAIAWTFNGSTYEVNANTPIYLGTSDGVFKSTLGGTSWSQQLGTDNLNVSDLKIDQYKGSGADPSTLYLVASTSGGLYRSDNAGQTWSVQNGGSDGFENELIKKVATDYLNGNIYAITQSNKVYSAAMYSVGSANEAWLLATTSAQNVKKVITDNIDPTIVYLATDNGMLSSSDGGSTWTSLVTGMNNQNLQSISSDYLYGNLFAAASTGAYFSNNSGSQWANANAGMGAVNLQDVVTNPIESSYVYAFSTTSAYRLILSNAGNTALGSLAANDILPPAMVTDVTLSNAGANSINLSWMNVGDDFNSGTATTFDVRYSTSSINDANWNTAIQVVGEPIPFERINPTTVSMTISGLSPQTLYYFAIKALDEVPNESPISGNASALTLPPGDIAPPSIPGSLITGTTSASVINISWAASTDNVGVVGYRVYRATTTGPLTSLATTTNLFYSDASGKSLTAYSYRIDAYDLAGNTSVMSVIISTSTLPMTPINFSATAASATGVDLSWSTTTEAISYYIVYRGGSQIATTSSSVGSYSDGGLTASTIYSYMLKAFANPGYLSNAATSDVTTQANSSSGSGGGGGGGGAASPTCTSWTYLAWGDCINGTQKRIVLSSLPNGCSGGTPVLTQSCTDLSATSTATTTITIPTITISASTPINSIDSDRDGLLDDFEVAIGTDPLKTDTDGDGYSDRDEVLKNFSPRVVNKKLDIDKNFSEKNLGKVFLQVENKGQAWYINPKDSKRYYLGRPANAFEVMRKQGLGVRHEIITKTKVYSSNLKGRILIDVEDKGRAYYINPQDKKAYYLGRPADAFEIMRRLGVGITDLMLNKVGIGI